MAAENRITRCLSRMTGVPIPEQNLAESLRELGLLLHRRMRRGAKTNGASRLQPSLGWDSQVALRFVNLRPSVQLRAMVEDWPLHRIQEAIQAQRAEPPRYQEGDPTDPNLPRAATAGNNLTGVLWPVVLIGLAAWGVAALLSARIAGKPQL